MSPDSQSLAAQFDDACAKSDIGSRTSAAIAPLAASLESISKELSQSSTARERLGESTSLWPGLRRLWRDLARAQLTFWDPDSDSDDEEGETQKNEQHELKTLCASLAKFTRNLVAGVPANQIRAFDNEPEIRRLLHYHTSWSAMEDEESISVARFLAQTLSNMVTANEVLMTRVWETYMNLPEDQVVLIRLLGSRDSKTLLTALILILNCIHGSRTRAKMLCRTAIGVRICVSLLDDMLALYDAAEASEGAKAFDIGYDIFARCIEEGLVPDLYGKFSMRGEIVTPHQTTLLKLVDSYLQSTQTGIPTAAPKTSRILEKLSPMLAECFFALSAYAQRAVRRSLGISSSTSVTGQKTKDPVPAQTPTTDAGSTTAIQPPAELDVMLPKVCEALVLVTQCIITITLETEEQRVSRAPGLNAPKPLGGDFKEFFNNASVSGIGLPENLIDLLRLLDLFLPRINFGKPVQSNAQQQSTAPSSEGFSYLKRDLVRLLGILCHGTRSVQDRVRESGGIQVVMNLCVVDERNPYLREHAIFTLHNILKGHAENQAVVDAIKPAGEWGEDGMLRDTPGAVRK